ncbi:hypothetical protein SK128_007499 [Halocaridina rubra]|uniref:Uncharacterized protein n=1 Tax=Halocaridina rubra TaxID=373956 RepID=A0AAN8XF56_HALRR
MEEPPLEISSRNIIPPMIEGMGLGNPINAFPVDPPSTSPPYDDYDDYGDYEDEDEEDTTK